MFLPFTEQKLSYCKKKKIVQVVGEKNLIFFDFCQFCKVIKTKKYKRSNFYDRLQIQLS